ncbi:Kelch repeat-containing protein [Pseudocercospora fuligena]|uniref:Kelch repeat-containing protein n=1 Tax=Pseudocercospora fuligena TaxID=685502 RepID=A0A8H6R864_9PEZI|nr:Kelch repeat-containing protein [Pseudocercospora fuligena]
MASSSTRRKSLFREHLDDEHSSSSTPVTRQTASAEGKVRSRPTPSVRFRSSADVRVVERYDVISGPGLTSGDSSKHTKNDSTISSTVSIHSRSPLPARNNSTMYRLGAAIALLLAVVPLLQSTSFFGHATILQPVSGSAIPNTHADSSLSLQRRADSPTDVCFRWAQQSAIVNGTLYLYGGQATTEPGQTENAWNNNFLTLDLTKTWQIATPSLTGKPQSSGPPKVSLGTLWNSHESLYLYGGQFQWKPAESPTAFSLWEYSISNDQWIEHSNPETSEGVSAPNNGDPVQRAAEGAAANVPSLGRGFYFGGHLDGYTTEGWSQSIARVYLQSLLEYTFPGEPNTQVTSLSNNQDAGADGVYRNITQGGLQAEAGFTQRADGLLIYVPGFGEQGILLALAGGTNETFTQMNNINVYDIAKSSWYTQTTSGPIPDYRVNPCAVIAAAPDGSSYNIYMFGGQNLIPAGNQTQKNDMWILTLPSFTWIEVDMSGQSVPYGRSGHTCNVWDGQMVMVGGYVGDQSLTCESPGIYVFDMSAAQWVNEFTAKSPGADGGSSSGSLKDDGSDSTGSNNPFNQQPNQKYSADSPGGLEGSYGYTVPQAVIDVVGGDKSGGATLTTPINTATAGPMATGKPITYTLPDGSTTTSTSSPDSSGNSGSGSSGGSGVNVGAIVAGCVAGVLGVVIIYLLYCVFIYRKRLALYKRHVEMSQAQARGEKVAPIPGLLATNNSSSNNGKDTPSDPSRGTGAPASRWATRTSESGSGHSRGEGSSSTAYQGYNPVRRNSDVSVNEDLLAGQEPTFFGTLLHPRRSLRVVNRD